MRQLLSIPVSIFLALNPVWSGVAEAAGPAPTTPIQHVVVIFNENISFDHYFGTYPKAHESSRAAPLYGASEYTHRQRLQPGFAHE